MTDTNPPDKVVDTIKKLLNLAAKAGTPEEAANAMSKAQEWMVRYNLDVATVEGARPEDGKREQTKVEGGFYQHQRSLWDAVARLNFCVYWCQQYKVEGWGQYHPGGDRYAATKREWRMVLKKRHMLVGRVINTRTTIVMAQYLEQAVERITRERLKDNEGHHFGSYAMSFRKGATATVIEKIGDRRRELLDLEAERAERAAADAKAKGFATSTTLTLATLTDAERDANTDFMMGEPGYSARRRAETLAARQERAAQIAKEEAEYTAWAAANPEEARKREEAEQKREDKNAARRTGRRSSAGPRDNTDWGAYRAGREAARSISLDQQVDNGARTKIGVSK